MPVFVSTIRPCELGKEVEAQKIKVLLKESTHTSSLTQRLSPHLPDSRGRFFVLRHLHGDGPINCWLLWDMEMPSVAREDALPFARLLTGQNRTDNWSCKFSLYAWACNAVYNQCMSVNAILWSKRDQMKHPEKILSVLPNETKADTNTNILNKCICLLVSTA